MKVVIEVSMSHNLKRDIFNFIIYEIERMHMATLNKTYKLI